MTDFKFKNTRTYAVKIKASCSNGIATVSIYGIKEENEYTVSFSTKTISTIPYTIQYVDDNTLAAGTEKVKQAGANGVITETYIIKSLNGKVVSSKLLSKDTYNAMQRIILRGTKGTTTNNNNNSQISTPATPSEPTPTVPSTPEKEAEKNNTEENGSGTNNSQDNAGTINNIENSNN